MDFHDAGSWTAERAWGWRTFSEPTRANHPSHSSPTRPYPIPHTKGLSLYTDLVGVGGNTEGLSLYRCPQRSFFKLMRSVPMYKKH